MFSKWLGLALIFSTFGNATPILARSSCTTYVDQFDNIATVLGSPELSPITSYNGLRYNDFDAAPAQILGLGVIPASSPNIAAASINQDLIDSGATTLNPFGTLSTSGTTTKYFSLVEFYYACLVSTNGVPVPTGCTLEISGYNIYGKQVGSVAYAYAPTDELETPMSRAKLPLLEYIYLQNVTFAIATANVAPATTVLYLDNVTHVNCH